MKYALVLSVIMMSGCTTAAKMNVADLNYFQIDCNRRDEQLAFLQRQMTSSNERLVNGLRMTSPIGVVGSIIDGTYEQERATYDRKNDAIARTLIYQINANCPRPEPKPQGCTTISEQMPSGYSQGSRCNIRNRINRWEALVD
jgi:hypothetical protein